MQHYVRIILVLTEFNSSLKCHLQDNIYNTVIYCNNRGSKFHKKRNKTALPLPTTQMDLPETRQVSLPGLPTPPSGDGERIPLGLSLFQDSCPSFRMLLVSASLAGEECLWCWVSVCVCQRLRFMQGWKMFVSVCD